MTPTSTPTTAVAPACSEGALGELLSEVRTAFEEWDFDRARSVVAGAPGACQDEPEVRLFRELARAGQEINNSGEIPPSVFDEIVDQIVAVLEQRPDLANFEELPYPFNESGSDEAAPFEEALRRIKGGGPAWH
jgi:hypothetical protein